jgi:hypothetical protein
MRAETGTPEPDCVPDRQAWDTNTSGFVETYCGECHGTAPQFGAPYSLLDYDDLVAGAEGERRVDRMAARLLAGEMPPAGSSQPDHVALDTMIEWATCGQEHADHEQGLEADRPVFAAEGDPPPNTERFEFTADNFELGRDELDRYQCFTLEVPGNETRYIRRIEPIIDDARVLHHSLLSLDRSGTQRPASFECYGFPPGEALLYGWAPGQDPIQFDDGGLRVEPGDRLILQIHYNNGAGAEDVSDSSGLALYHGPLEGTEYLMRQTSTSDILVPPMGTASATARCTIDRETNILASWPHMHEIGSTFETRIERVDGSTESLISLTGWSFEAQLIYHTPVTLEPGDELVTTCTWESDRSRPTGFGLGTEDEMCFNFLLADRPICSGI